MNISGKTPTAWILAGILFIQVGVFGDVYINEINFNPVGNQNQEWIEIYNSGPNEVDLLDYTLTDGEFTFDFPSVEIGAGDYIVVRIGIGVNDSTNLYMGFTTGQLNNAGEELVLFDNNGAGVDYVAYGSGTFLPIPGGVTWSNNIGLASVSPGQTLSFTESTASQQDSGTNWSAQSSTIAKPNIAPTATLRINEILPEPGDGIEFFEIYHNGTGNLRDYTITTGSNSVSGFRLPFYSFSGTGYIVVYLQTLPGGAPGNSVALGLGADRFDNGGDNLRIFTFFNNTVSAVVSYNSAIGGFNPSISTDAPYAPGDSLAWLELAGTSPTNGNQWINRRSGNITPGTENTEQPDPSLSFGTLDPVGPYATCESITIPLLIQYESESYLRDVVVQLDLDEIDATGGSILFDQFTGGEAGSDFDSGDRVMTWEIGDLSADRSDLSITLIPGADLTEFIIPAEAVTMSYSRWVGDPSSDQINADELLGTVEVETPNISVEITEFVSGNLVQSAKAGQFVDLRVRVNNSGSGALSEGVADIFLGNDLRLITVREDNASGAAPDDYSGTPQDGSWSIPSIPAGNFQDYYVRVRVAACLDLQLDVFVSSGCTDGGEFSEEVVVEDDFTVVCPLEVTYELPSSGVTAGEDFEYTIFFSNSSIFDAEPGDITVNIPEAFYFMEARDEDDNVLDVPGGEGTYDGTVSGGFRTITISADSFLPGGIIPMADTTIVNGNVVGSPSVVSLTLVLRGTCEPESDQKIENEFEYDLGPLTLPVAFETKGVTTDQPVLSVLIADPEDTISTTVLASRGNEINFLLEIVNNGDGDLSFTDDPEGALAEIVNVADGLEIIGVYDGAPSDAPNQNDLPAGPNLIDPSLDDFDWKTGDISSGDRKAYTVRLKVIDCDDLSFGAQASYSVSGRPDVPLDVCEFPASPSTSAAGSVEIELNAPFVELDVPTDLDLAYCENSLDEDPGALMEIAVENVGFGAATSLNVDIDFLDLDNYDLVVVDNDYVDDYESLHGAYVGDLSDFELEIVGGVAIFTLFDGTDEDSDGEDDDLGAGETRYIRFYLQLKENGEACSSDSGGTAMVTADYNDLCDFNFLGTIEFFSWSRSERSGEVELSGISDVAGIHSRGSLGTLTYNLDYVGEPESEVDYTFTVDFPSISNEGDFADFTIGQIRVNGNPVDLNDEYTVNVSTGTITFEVDADTFGMGTGVFDEDGTYSIDFEIDYTAPANACGIYTVDADAVWVNSTDCNGCPLPGDGILNEGIQLDFGAALGVIDLSGATELDPGESGVWDLDVFYTGTGNGAFSYLIEVDLDGFTVDGVTGDALGVLIEGDDFIVVGSTLQIQVDDVNFDGNGEYVESFEIAFTAPDPSCDDINIQASLLTTDDEDLCVENPPAVMDQLTVDFPLTPSDEVELVLSGGATINPGDSGVWNVDIVYIGPASSALEYELVFEYPDDFEIDLIERGDPAVTLNEGVDYTIDLGNNLITIPVSDSFDGSGDYEEQFEISYTSSINGTGGPFSVDATMTVVTPTDQVDSVNCPIAEVLEDSTSMQFASPGDYIVGDSERSVIYLNINGNGLDNSAVTSEGEVCTTIRLRTLFDFDPSDSETWEDVVFTDTLTDGLEVQGDDIENLNLKVYYFSSVGFPPVGPSGDNFGPSEFGGTNLVELMDVDYNSSTQTITIDFEGLDSLVSEPNRPGDGGVLWVEYDVVSSTSTPLSDAFDEEASLSLPPGGTSTPGLYSPETSITVTSSEPEITIERISGDAEIVDSCDVITIRLPISSNKPWDLYDSKVIVELGNLADLVSDYEYVENSVVFDGLLDEDGNTLNAFEPEISGDADDVLTWNLGDLRDVEMQEPYIEFELVKVCESSETFINAMLLTQNHCENIDDAGVSSLEIGDYGIVADAQYEPRHREGIIAVRWATELVYYTTGYPTLRFDILNVGRGSLHNVRIPIELGDLGDSDGRRTLSYVSSNIVKIEGGVPGAGVGPLTDSGTARIVDVDSSNSGLNGDTVLELHIDEIEPSSIVTVTVKTRMHLDSNLEAHIFDATWGCDLNDGFADCNSSTPNNLLNDSIDIQPATTRVEITSHTAVPNILDFCGDETEIMIRLANVGGVQAYEPILTETLPEGLKIIPGSVQVRLNDAGSFVDFDQGTAADGNWNTSYEVNGAGQEVISWNFADPDDDDNELDFTYLDGVAFNDPTPADSDGVGTDFFTRGRVLKPGQSIELRFRAAIDSDSCVDALAYSEGSRIANATVVYDLPSNHNNAVDPNNSFSLSPNRDPLESSSLVSNFLDPGNAAIGLSIVGENVTQSGASSSIRVNAEEGDLLDWTVTMESQGDGNIPEVVLVLEIPDTLEATNFSIASPANISIGSVDDQVSGSSILYTIIFENEDFEDQSYFNSTDTVVLNFDTEVVGCSSVPVAINGILSFGCCDGGDLGSPEVLGANGFDVASTEVKTRPTLPSVVIFEGSDSGVDEGDFEVCGGRITFTVQNPDVNNELSLRELLLEFPLPAGYTYDDSFPTEWTYSGAGARNPGDQGNYEPEIDAGNLVWSGENNTEVAGNIPDEFAIIFPQETIELTFYLKADGNCDTDPESSVNVPSFTQELNIIFEDSCGGVLERSSSIMINPESPNLNISIEPDPGFIDGNSDEVVWTMVIENNGDLEAENVSVILDFADGYTGTYSINITSDPGGALANATIDMSTVSSDPLGPEGTSAHDLEIIFNDPLEVGQYSVEITRDINTTTRGNLEATAIIRGQCLDYVGDPNCLYSYRYDSGVVAGGDLVKITDGESFNEPSVGDDLNGDVTGTFPVIPSERFDTSNVTIGSIIREVLRIEIFEGGSSDLELVYLLPVGVKLLHANLIDDAGVRISDLEEVGGDTTGVLTFEINDVTGGAIGDDAIFAEVWLQVTNNLSQNIESDIKTIVSQLNIARGNVTYTANSYASLSDQTQYILIEPDIRTDDQEKTSVPESLADDHTGGDPLDTSVDDGVTYTFTVTNTGTSPAYELAIEDLIPFGLGDPTAETGSTELSVKIIEDDDVTERTLSLNTDYTLDFNNDPDFGDPDLMTIQLLATEDAQLRVNETLVIEYYAPIVGGAPGSFIDNQAIVTGYSSLPDTGTSVAISGAGTFEESDEERIEYTDTYRLLFPKFTYHLITGELTLEKTVRATITEYDDETPAGDFTSTNSTRATIGEEIVYRIRLTIPPNIKIYEPVFEDMIPDGLTVEKLEWELVNAGDEFGAGVEEITGFSESNGVTTIVVDTDDFPEDIPNPGFPNGVASERDLLVQITATVDRSYHNDSAVLTGDTISNQATFNWQTVTSVVEDYSRDSNNVDFTIREPNVDFTVEGKQVTSIGTGNSDDYRNYYLEGPEAGAYEEDVANVPQYTVGATVVYELEITNSGDATAYEVVVEDLIPTGMTYVANSATITSANSNFITDPPVAIAEGTNPQYSQVLEFEFDEIAEGETVVVEYELEIDTPVVAGRYLQNKAELIDFTTLPGDEPSLERSIDDLEFPVYYGARDPVFAGIGTPYPTVTKSQDTELTATASNGVTIGELITYTLEVNVGEDYLLPDFWLYDEVGDGLDVQDVELETEAGFGTASADFNVGERAVEVTVENGGQNDPVGTAVDPDLTVRILATVNQSNDATSQIVSELNGPLYINPSINSFVNEFYVSWNQVDEDPDPTVDYANSYLDGNEVRGTINDLTSDSVSINVLEPHLNVFTKSQSNMTDGGRGSDIFYTYTSPTVPTQIADVAVVLPDDVIRYTITVENNGSVPAFNVIVTDVLPSQEFVTFVEQVVDGIIDADDIVSYSGSTGSEITATPSPVDTDIDSIEFEIDFILAGESAEIVYEIEIDRELGAGLYIGENTATLSDYSTLPDNPMNVDVGNLGDAEEVYNSTLARSILSAPAYDSFEDGDDLGVMWPTITKSTFRLFNDDGEFITPEAVNSGDEVRIGELLRYIVSIDIPPHTVLFDGPSNNALALVDRLPRGFKLREGSETNNFSGLLTGVFTPSAGTNPNVSSVDSNQRFEYRWLFEDIANGNDEAVEWEFSFDVDVTGYRTDGVTDVGGLSLTSLFSPQANRIDLFWNTIDDPSSVLNRANQSTTYVHNTNPSSGDKPSLRTTATTPRYGQPNISAVKEAYEFDSGSSGPDYLGDLYAANDEIGVTGAVGDEIVYRLAYTALGNETTNTPAYGFLVHDVIPGRLRSAISAGADLDSAEFVAFIQESVGGETILTPNEDYDFSYDSNTGELEFLAKYNSTDSVYRSAVDPGDVLIIAYKVQVDAGVGATGGGVGQRVNIVDANWESYPADIVDPLITANLTPIDPSVGRNYEDLNRTFVLNLPSPEIHKTSLAPFTPETSVSAGDIIEYVITLPATPVRADMYDVVVTDELPDGIIFESDDSTTGVASDTGVDLTLGPNTEVSVVGGSGDVEITVDGGTLTVRIDKIENSDTDPDDALDDPDGDTDQVQIFITAQVSSTGVFENGAPIARLHEFNNRAQFFWYDDLSANSERIRYAALSDVVVHYYEATGILFAPDHTRTVDRGSVVVYRHVLRNFEDEMVNVPVEWESTLGWGWQLFLADGDGNPTSGPYEEPYTINLPAEGDQEILMRAFVPMDIAPFATDILIVSADGPDDNDITVTDISIVQDQQIAIVKDISDDDGSSFATRLEVDPTNEDFIIQRLRFINTGKDSVKNVYVYDFMPEMTEYVSESATNDGSYVLEFSIDGGVTWTVGEPSEIEPETAVPGGYVVPTITNLRWKYEGNGGLLTPGTTHEIQFKIRVK